MRWTQTCFESAAAHFVILELGDVVGDVVDQVHPELLPGLAEKLGEDFTRLVSQELAVAPGIVGRGAHRAQVSLALRAAHRGTGKLRVGKLEAVAFGGVLEGRQVVVANLVAEAARARMDQDGDLALAQTHHLGCNRVEHAVDDLDFEEVVARAERAALVEAASDCPIADAARVSAIQAAAGLGDEQVMVGTKSQVDDVRRPFGHETGELGLVELILPALTDAGGNVTKELLDQRPDPILDVAQLEVRGAADARRS